MDVATAQRAATIWFDEGLPVGLCWNGRDWHVLDTPTQIGLRDDVVYSPFITHPPTPWTGWRFIARAVDDVETYVFDVRETTPTHCEVLRVFE